MTSSLGFWFLLLISMVVSEETVKNGADLKCYQCNSAYSPVCDDPFDVEKGKSMGFLLTCAPHPNRNEYGDMVNYTAVGCRKGLQNVGSQSRIIRQCSYSGENNPKEENKGTKRVGSGKNENAVRMWYWHCAKEGCNGASGLSISLLSAVLLQVVLVFVAK